MASVTSLGLHEPTALRYAIQEQLLPETATASDYSWEITVNHDGDDVGEDELLVTQDAVVWSRGNIFRKCFGFKLDKEPVTQALLTYFPTSEESPKQEYPHGPKQRLSIDGRPLSKALVVFLKTQAHIYFLDGTSHVVHMPFEVESAVAAPQGVIIQRKQRNEVGIAASVTFPRVPPNSFISPQSSPVSQTTFTTETLGRPKALPLRLSSTTIDNMWELPSEISDSHWPRLVSLVDPLLELGLVVTQPDRPAKQKGRRSSSKSPDFLDKAEEILHLEEIQLPNTGRDPHDSDQLVLAVTINRETSMYSVWRFTYIHNEDPFRASKTPKKPKDRRRSSMQPGHPSGVTSPVQASFNESFGAPLPRKRTRKSEKQDKTDRAIEKFESSLGLDKDTGIGRRASRRVSSMLARADLSASQDRTAFGEQAQVANNTGTRRETSLGSHRAPRTSGAFPSVSFSGTVTQSTMGSFLEAPVDDLLEELRSGGDFEGFHNMGLDDHDFDGLAQEMRLLKIHSVPVENSNVRYSLSKQPARTQCNVFCMSGPWHCADDRQRRQVLIGIQDPMEKRLQLLTLSVQVHMEPKTSRKPKAIDINFMHSQKAQNVIDSCKIVDGPTAMILVLSDAGNGQRVLSLEAPGRQFTPLELPPKLSLANIRSLGYRGSEAKRDVGLRRSIVPPLGEIAAFRHSKLNGIVDIVDGESQQLHQIRIQLRPTNRQVAKALDILRIGLGPDDGDKLLPGWWQVMKWMQHECIDATDIEWSAFVILLTTIFLALGATEFPRSVHVTRPSHRRRRGHLRSSSGVHVDLSDWDVMNTMEAPNFATHPHWMEHTAWKWALEKDDAGMTLFKPSQGREEEMAFFSSHVKHAQSFMATDLGQAACGPGGYLATGPGFSDANRSKQAQNALVALHLLLEEQKLDITTPTTVSPGPNDLRAIILQIAKWLKWSQWVNTYDLEMPLDFADNSNDITEIAILPPEPPIWNIFDWIQGNLMKDSTLERTLPAMTSNMSIDILPRIKMFDRLFYHLKLKGDSPMGFVEAMHDSGITHTLLESLPEAVLVPLQDAIAQCQARPPPGWSKELLALVDRSDVGSVLTITNQQRLDSAHLMTSSHLASWDFSSLCQNVMDFNDAPTDDVAESDKQAVIRAIFKEDRRLDETRIMLTTTKPRAIRLDPQSGWSDAFYLEQQKELVTRLATNTLSIPAGRGLMNYGLRFPLLTQKFHINGFVLNCTVTPTNQTVGVDKTLFTEEKIAWAFFHSGVAGGLSISRQAKGIDTSWILYNKPGNDLNNRHAGFLLALGLNGHLKGVAKWVAFKYLTPKHTMTSIGLLLGLAASYIGTMDSLITRLLSVHVTRMLPRGAAELNLSPLTQTTGIMGIGLLYCNSQHRRMSEIMMSEISHIETGDEEEPLRSECYRLAAGFALGFINLGKGSDLKGLHDMRITEQLLMLASTSKKVELVHILDRSSAAAIVAIALIYMKSEDHIVARKIDVPDAMLQFDYIRPDLLLLRTLAKHLILWSEIKPTHDWIRKNLPSRYQSRVSPPTQPFNGPGRGPLNSTHLPFLTILAGLCFAIGLRYAGSGDPVVRDLLLNYLYRYYGLCRSTPHKANFDERAVQVTGRMCLDVVALSTAAVMAGTCDIKVLRILRSLHGRNDPETTFGSHMAIHMAMGVLSLGCGTQTFSTSNLAIASLLVAFYPVFPDQVQDNKSHLQAFRHFWVLATDPRCLVTKDVATDTPVGVPIRIRFKDGRPEEARTTPCLLPPLDDITSVSTTSPEYWNMDLDFTGGQGKDLRDKFALNQVLHLRRRPAGGSPFSATMLALGRQSPGGGSQVEETSQPLEWLFTAVGSLRRLTHAERGIVLDTGVGGPDVGLSNGSVVDARLMLEEAVRNGRRDDLLALRGLFEWVDGRARKVQTDKNILAQRSHTRMGENNHEWIGESWLRDSVVESLKGMIWLAGREGGE
ncbi:Negative regulator of mitosis [Apiospora rasikravindrae]|uniref:Negative regulator of mitosis n=1 Tax=Apiospora rasikravindrae TaxID=990691 RepID=A0ABR1SIZ8_9PEZI